MAWSAMVCHGLPWSAIVCLGCCWLGCYRLLGHPPKFPCTPPVSSWLGLLWSSLICHGLPWSASLCLSLPWSALVSHGLPRSALVFIDLPWSVSDHYRMVFNAQTSHLETPANALCVKPLRNLEIKNLQKMMTLAPIFSSQNYFRWKYLEVFSFAVSLSIYIWVRVEKSLLQQQKLPKNQLQFKQAAERMCIKLRGPVEHFPWKLNPNIFLPT